MHEHTAVSFDQQQPRRKRQVRRKPPGIIHGATSNNQAHNPRLIAGHGLDSPEDSRETQKTVLKAEEGKWHL